MRWLNALCILVLFAIVPQTSADSLSGVSMHGGRGGGAVRQIYRAPIRGNVAFNVGSYVNTTCLDLWDTHNIIRGIQTCISYQTKLLWPRDILITEFTMTMYDDDGVNPVEAGDGGCSFQLMTGLLGFTTIASGELHVPASVADIDIGDVFSVLVGYELAAGDTLTIAVKDGDFCPSNGTCACDGQFDSGFLEIWGVMR